MLYRFEGRKPKQQIDDYSDNNNEKGISKISVKVLLQQLLNNELNSLIKVF